MVSMLAFHASGRGSIPRWRTFCPLREKHNTPLRIVSTSFCQTLQPIARTSDIVFEVSKLEPKVGTDARLGTLFLLELLGTDVCSLASLPHAVSQARVSVSKALKG